MRQPSLKRNFLMNTLLNLSSFLFPLITFPYVSRVLTPVGTGKVAFATSVVSYFTMFAQLGLPVYGIRACAQVRDDRQKLTKTVHELFLLQLITMTAAYAAFLLGLLLVPRLRAEKTLFLILSMSMLFGSIGMEWLYQALEQYSYITLRSLFFRTVSLVATFLLVRRQEDYVLYGCTSMFAAAASGLCNFLQARKYIGIRPLRQYRLLPHLKSVFLFFAMACATTVYTQLDTVMVGFYKTDADVGLYNTAVKVKLILATLVSSMGAVLLPRASYWLEQGRTQEFFRLTGRAIRFVFLAALPLMAYFTLFAREVVLVLSGDGYTGAILPLRLLLPTLLFIGLTNVMGIQVLVPLGKERTVLLSVAAGAAVDCAVNMLLIPPLASVGAAIGTLIAETVVWLIQFFALRGSLGPCYRQVPWGRLLPAVAMSTLLSAGIRLLPLNSLGVLCLSAPLFFGSYGLVLLLTREPMLWELLRSLLRRFQK